MRSLLVGLVLAGCGSSTPPPRRSPADGDAANVENDPRVSKSAGEEGGIVVLWPRVVGIPENEPLALQSKLREIAAATLPDAPVDLRPDPERTCPRAGCNGVSVGALLVQQNQSCLVVVLVAEAGPSPTHLIPVMGRMTIRETEIPFREPAESFVHAQDFADCATLDASLESHRAEIAAAIEDAS